MGYFDDQAKSRAATMADQITQQRSCLQTARHLPIGQSVVVTRQNGDPVSGHMVHATARSVWLEVGGEDVFIPSTDVTGIDPKHAA